MAGFAFQLRAAAFGDLPAAMKAETARAAAAMSGGIDATSAELLATLREQVMNAFGSQRLANSWRRQMFPRPPKTSIGAAATIWSNAPHIIEAFSAATVITSPNGFWLAIPTPDVLTMRFAGNHRATPALVEQRLGIRLRFVYRQGKSSLLVADQVRRHTGQRKGFGKASATSIRKGTAEAVVMFFLVPMARLSQRLNPEEAYDAAVDKLVRNVMAEWGE